ncbi:hypothetical protein J5277_30285 [Rhizobium sp. 16-449-1b]|uniref:hypothetical protein n=1 Tax=Rhizobium sp. 16-449-1b TaxID=2819989 RepID=UPI001ADD27B3|nr:hypothetical protein [Rhizobium sp. 16-449-1b]MBO9198415.1 hypothetical protein [Rhizobium sp. 16-449-1b]
MANFYNENTSDASHGIAKSTLTAFFDTRSEAESAVERLNDAGVANARLMAGYEADAEKANVAADDRGGFFDALKDWFFPDEDRSMYAEGLRRGGFLVSASVDDATYETAHDILDEHGAIDMDERADLWREEGWTASQVTAAPSFTGEPGLNEAEAATQAAGVGRYARSTHETSPRIRAYELDQELPDDVRDDVLPTGHQRDVAEGEKSPEEREMGGLRLDQPIPRV